MLGILDGDSDGLLLGCELGDSDGLELGCAEGNVEIEGELDGDAWGIVLKEGARDGSALMLLS